MTEPTEPERVHRFFDELLPAVVALRAGLFDRVKGTLALFVEGTGSWTVAFGDHASAKAVNEGADFDAARPTCVLAVR
jgi:hypothetical protein